MSEYELKSSVTFYPYTDVDIIKISRTPEQSEKDAWDSKDEMGAGSVMMTDFDRNVTSAYYLFTEGETVFSIFKRNIINISAPFLMEITPFSITILIATSSIIISLLLS